MIQDINPKHFYNQFQKEIIENSDYVISFHNNLIFATEAGQDLGFIRYEDFWNRQGKVHGETEPEKEFHFTYLFTIDRQKYFLLKEDVELEIPGFAYCKMFDIRRRLPKEQIMAASTAWHLYVWYRDNRFCGRCGKETEEDEKDRILMTKYANREYKRYALIAGFTEIGETVEETVRREVLEEVGLHVKNIRYYKSQPWGFDLNLLLGFFCELDDTAPIHMDEGELSLAEWVKREDIPDYGEDLSLTHEMMQRFKRGEY